MASSFSSAAKAEVCRILPQKHCCALAECFGILLFANNFSADGIKKMCIRDRFITKVENGVTMNEGYCLKCARSLGIPQIDQAVKQMGISDEDLDMLLSLIHI